jgi:hypothetical protein
MDGKENLIRHLKKLRKNLFYSRIGKITPLFFFVILTPISIYSKVQEKDILTVVLLTIAELFFLGIIVVVLKSATEYNNIKNSRIYQCIENPGAVNEIVVTPHKIVFEIKGMEDESIFLRESKFRTELLTYIKEVFGEKKIVINY